jgi:predicted ArsR family transcriptional regulator
MLRKQLLDSSRGRVVALLQRGTLTVDDLAAKLGVTANAVRAQLTAMERDGVVRKVGQRPGTTRPFHVYELTPDVEQLLSRAYIPLMAQLVDVFSNTLSGERLEASMRAAGKALADELCLDQRPSGSLEARVMAASEFLNEQLGAVTQVEKNGGYVIRGQGCPLSALTGKHPPICLAMESFVTEMVGAPVHECCDRIGRPRCCFEIKRRRAGRL